MDCMTRPLNRIKIRQISKCVREIFGFDSDEPIPVLEMLEKTCILFKGTEYSVVKDDELPAEVFAWCYQKPEGGFNIEIKQTVYDGAYNDNNRVFLSFICHEICHVILFYLGYTPISTMASSKDNKIPVYCSVEWQAKALCGELTIPYEATIGMKAKEIASKYHVTEASAKYRVKLDKKKK